METTSSGPVGSGFTEGLGGERAAFEAAIERELNYGFDFKQDPSGNYLHDATDTAWTAWQARAALAAERVQLTDEQVAAIDACEAVSIESGAYESYRAVGNAFDRLRAAFGIKPLNALVTASDPAKQE